MKICLTYTVYYNLEICLKVNNGTWALIQFSRTVKQVSGESNFINSEIYTLLQET
jgi:hypothetical protein